MVSDFLITQASQMLNVEENEGDNVEMLCRTIHVLVVITSVRSGTRLMEDHHGSMLSFASRLIPLLASHREDTRLAKTILLFSTAVLLSSSELAASNKNHTTNIRSLLDDAWKPVLSDFNFGVALHGSLAALKWNSWKTLGVESVSRASRDIFLGGGCDYDRQWRMVELLAYLNARDHLDEGNIVLKDALNRWIKSVVSQTVLDKVAFCMQLSPCLFIHLQHFVSQPDILVSLSTCLTSEISLRLIKHIERILESNPFEWSQEHRQEASGVLYSCLSYLGRRPAGETGQLNVPAILQACINGGCFKEPARHCLLRAFAEVAWRSAI